MGRRPRRPSARKGRRGPHGQDPRGGPGSAAPHILDPSGGTPPAAAIPQDGLDASELRAWIHAGRKIAIRYRDEQGRETERTIWPVAIGYLQTVRMMAGWCELRRDFRHFRLDRVQDARFLQERYPERPKVLKARWHKAMEAEHHRGH